MIALTLYAYLAPTIVLCAAAVIVYGRLNSRY